MLRKFVLNTIIILFFVLSLCFIPFVSESNSDELFELVGMDIPEEEIPQEPRPEPEPGTDTEIGGEGTGENPGF